MSRRLLFITPQAAAPLQGGGALRISHLVGQLSRGFETHLFVPHNAPQTRTLMAERGWEVQVYSPEEYRRTRVQQQVATLRRKVANFRWRRHPFHHAFIAEPAWYPLLLQLLTDLQPDIVLLEHVWKLRMLARLRRQHPAAFYLMDAQNVEARNLLRYFDSLPRGVRDVPTPWAWWMLQQQIHVERSLAQYVDAVWACSATDLAALQRENPGVPGAVVPNGVDTRQIPFDGDPHKRLHRELIYVGHLGYAPSSEGLRFFYQQVLPLLRRTHPDVRLTIVGHAAPAWLLDLAQREPLIVVHSSVPDVRPYLQRAAISICPLLSGSGTRLKILEAMSSGLPVVSTRVGAEGIAATHGEHLLLADEPAPFAQAICHLLDDPAAYEQMRHAARKLVEHVYDWDVIGVQARAWLDAYATARR